MLYKALRPHNGCNTRTYQALFLGAGPQMHCGVGQFTRLLSEAIEKLEPGSCTMLTLTRSEGTLAEIWRATGSAHNIEAPTGIADSKLRRRLAARRDEGRLVIGHFGSIYPGKQPNALLEICAILKERGKRPLIVYVGSFIRGVDEVEKDFFPAPSNLAYRTTSSSAATSHPSTRCSACSARSTRSAIRSTKA